MSRSSVITMPRKPNSPRSKSVMMRRESEVGTPLSSSAGENAWPIIIESTGLELVGAEKELKTGSSSGQGDAPVVADEREVALVAEVVRIRRLVADELQPRDAPAFLINGDDRLRRAHVAKVVAEFAELRGGLDVSPEDDECAGLDAAESDGGLRVEHGTGHAGHEELAERRHGIGDW